VRESIGDGQGLNQNDMISLCSLHAEDRRDLITRVRARLQSDEYVDQLRRKYIASEVTEGTRTMLAGNKQYMLARRQSHALGFGADDGVTSDGARAQSSAELRVGPSLAARAGDDESGPGPSLDPSAAAWLHGRVRWSQSQTMPALGRRRVLSMGRPLDLGNRVTSAAVGVTSAGGKGRVGQIRAGAVGPTKLRSAAGGTSAAGDSTLDKPQPKAEPNPTRSFFGTLFHRD